MSFVAGAFYCWALTTTVCVYQTDGPTCEKYLLEQLQKSPEQIHWCELRADPKNIHHFIDYDPKKRTITRVQFLDMRRLLGRN